MENIALCHDLLTDEGVPLQGPFGPLSLADRLTAFVAQHHSLRDAKRVCDRDLKRLPWLERCEKAIESMAAQFLCPKTSPEQMVADILGDGRVRR